MLRSLILPSIDDELKKRKEHLQEAYGLDVSVHTTGMPRCWRCEAIDWERFEEVITRVSNDREWLVLQCRECGARMEANLINGKVEHTLLRR